MSDKELEAQVCRLLLKTIQKETITELIPNRVYVKAAQITKSKVLSATLRETEDRGNFIFDWDHGDLLGYLIQTSARLHRNLIPLNIRRDDRLRNSFQYVRELRGFDYLFATEWTIVEVKCVVPSTGSSSQEIRRQIKEKTKRLKTEASRKFGFVTLGVMYTNEDEHSRLQFVNKIDRSIAFAVAEYTKRRAFKSMVISILAYLVVYTEVNMVALLGLIVWSICLLVMAFLFLTCIILTTCIAGGAYCLGKYASWKMVELQEKIQQEKIARENMRRRFQLRQLDCSFAVVAHLSTIAENLLTEFDVNSNIAFLQKAKNNSNTITTNTTINSSTNSINQPIDRKSKLECLNEVKNKRRYNYLYSVVSLTERDREQSIQIQSSSGSTLSSKTEQKYLTFIWWFLNVGSKKAIERIKEAVESILSGVSLKKEISHKHFIWLLSEIRARIEKVDEGNQTHGFPNVMMPESHEDELSVLNQGGDGIFEAFIDSELRKLLDETKDYLHSQDFATVLSSCLNSAFNLLCQDLYINFVDPQSNNNNEVIDEIFERNVILLKLLPIIAKRANVILHDIPNRFLDVIRDTQELQAFSAIIYSSFDSV
ncbi:21938_t:CDS:10 [Dentiscutata erythropus]|uniref:21938_t:CDS:1 n=1 Tax=Dentiscutata erythropus TaxID=1348616 RepID=A0A9N9GIJ1_9GLOM|nr:21938_t:CDS:10 [Dentiscutata erythropus]